MADNSKVLAFIAATDDPAKLNALIENSRARGAKDIEMAAFKRLIHISPSDQPGSLEHDVWRMVFAFEHLLKQERGKTVMLSRTRQKLGRVGALQMLSDWACDARETDGFRMLMDRGVPELTGEAIVLRHSARFPDAVVVAARERLREHGVEEAAIALP